MSSNVALRSDMLVRLEEGGALDALGLDLSSRPDLTIDQWQTIGTMLGRATTALRWAVGDWLCEGEIRFGELAAQASEALGMSPEGRLELSRVARAIPRERRRPGLSWTHHRAVASRDLDLRERDRLLDRAEREGLTANQLSTIARELRDNLPLPRKDPDCEVLVEQGARDLRECLLADCGFESSLAVEVTIRDVGVEYTIVVGGEA